MARPRRYETAAERQRAYRERQGTEPESDTTAESERASRQAAGAPSEARSPSAEDLYVAHHLEQTKAYAASFTSKEKREGLPQRLERAESYARWRFRAFHSGEVASL